MKPPQVGAHDIAGGPRAGSPRMTKRVMWIPHSRRYYVLVVLLIVALYGMTTIALQFMASTGIHILGSKDNQHRREGEAGGNPGIEQPPEWPPDNSPAEGLSPPLKTQVDWSGKGQKTGRFDVIDILASEA